MVSFKETFRRIKEEVDLSLMPSAYEIKDPEKRREFHEDYQRLVGRCGRKVMSSVLNLYLIEQMIQDIKETKIPHKITIFGHNNTSQIITRLVEEGYADYYFSEKPLSPTAIFFNEDGKPILTASFHSDFIRYKGKRDGLPKVLTPEVKRIQSLKENATLIPPEQIRSVFAKINAQYIKPF